MRRAFALLVAIAIFGGVATSWAMSGASGHDVSVHLPNIGALVARLRLHRITLGSSSGPTPIGDRQEFSPNACVQVALGEGADPATVFIDPGHGGPDPGAQATYNGKLIKEKALTLPVALDMVPLLQKAGYRVVLSRTEDTSVVALRPGYVSDQEYTIAGDHADVATRAACANAAGARLLLSIHFDAYGDPAVGGSETIYDDVRSFSADNLRFARLVQQSVISTLASAGITIPDRGVMSDSEAGTPALTAQGAAYGHLLELGPAKAGWFSDPSRMPGALVEPLFITDPNEAALALSEHGQHLLAKALASAVEQYFGAKSSNTSSQSALGILAPTSFRPK